MEGEREGRREGRKERKSELRQTLNDNRDDDDNDDDSGDHLLISYQETSLLLSTLHVLVNPYNSHEGHYYNTFFKDKDTGAQRG